jgi:hypothetical protein
VKVDQPPTADELKERYPELEAFFPGFFEELAAKWAIEARGATYEPTERVKWWLKMGFLLTP